MHARDYCTKFERLLDDAPPMSEQDILYTFHKGLPPWLQQWMSYEEPKTLHNAITLTCKMAGQLPQTSVQPMEIGCSAVQRRLACVLCLPSGLSPQGGCHLTKTLATIQSGLHGKSPLTWTSSAAWTTMCVSFATSRVMTGGIASASNPPTHPHQLLQSPLSPTNPPAPHGHHVQLPQSLEALGKGANSELNAYVYAQSFSRTQCVYLAP
mgnify:CR=1 FL=1